jgi:3-oxoacyl-[acyl-carrier protein] reductase
MDISGCSAIVTGGAGGLGRRLGLALAKAGTHVVVVDSKPKDEISSCADQLTALGPAALAVQADIADQAGIDDMLSRTEERFGRVDILINTAVYHRLIPFQDLQTLDEAAWTRMMHVNLTAPFLAMRSVAPIMKRQGGGRIVNISSVAGLAPIGSSISYAVSKAALIHLTRCMAVALAPEVLVNAVAPGMMEGTGVTANLAADAPDNYRKVSALKRTVDKDDVADAVLLLIRTDSITGQTLVIDAGVHFH